MKMELDNRETWYAVARTNKSIPEICKEYGCNENYMYHLLNHKGIITPYIAGKLARALDVDVKEIVKEVGS